jgi:single-strand DNA-binding protein
MNVSIVKGTLSRPPEPRVLGSGSTVVGYDVAISSEHGPAETVPVSWFDPPAAAASLGEGDEVLVTGRVRRRFYRAGGRTQSRTDVVADSVVRTTAKVRAARALQAAVDRLGTEHHP